MISLKVNAKENVRGWHVTRQAFLDSILSEGLRYGYFVIFYQSLPPFNDPIEIFSGPSVGKFVARDTYLELDLQGIDLLMVFCPELGEFDLTILQPIPPSRIKVMCLEELIERAKELEWMPYETSDALKVDLDDSRFNLSRPLIGCSKWDDSMVRRCLDPETREMDPKSIEESRAMDSPNVRFWLELEDLCCRNTTQPIQILPYSVYDSRTSYQFPLMGNY